MTARWRPQQIPPSNFLASDIFYIRAHFTKYQHQFFNEVNISEALISLYRHIPSLQLQGSSSVLLENLITYNDRTHFTTSWTRRSEQGGFQTTSLDHLSMNQKVTFDPIPVRVTCHQATSQCMRTFFFFWLHSPTCRQPQKSHQKIHPWWEDEFYIMVPSAFLATCNI